MAAEETQEAVETPSAQEERTLREHVLALEEAVESFKVAFNIIMDNPGSPWIISHELKELLEHE